MPKSLLTTLQIRAAKPAERADGSVVTACLRDGGGLFLHVQPNGSKLWRYRYRIGGRPNLFAIGRYPDVSLDEARAERERAVGLVKKGIHPAIERQTTIAAQIEANETTFQSVARRWMGAQKKWKPAYARQVERDLENDVFPKIGRIPIIDVQAPHLRPIVLSVAERGAECTAINIRMWFSQIFRYAAAHGLTRNDPAAVLKGLVQRPSVRHHPHLGWDEIPKFLRKLDDWAGYRTTVIAMQLMALTFVRTCEMRFATWAEVDFDNARWELPAERMKMRRPHIVPLSTQAVSLMRELHQLTGGSKNLLPNYRDPNGKTMSATTINRALERLGYKGQFSGHGFRSTATTMLGRLSYSDKRVDLQLAHSKQKRDASRAPYDHNKFLGYRRLMMQDWADILDRLKQGKSFSEVTEEFGPNSARRAAFNGVAEGEDD